MPATEHSEFDSLVMYARRKIVSAFDMFSIGSLDVGSHLFKLVPAGMACLTVLKYCLRPHFSAYDEDHLYR